jgi:hypothetical protein
MWSHAMTPVDQMLHGSCLCGGIAFHAARPATNASHCYCTMCQRFHGAAAGSYIDVAASGYVLERGAELLVEYASSEQGRRGFCKTCGSSLYWRSTGTPDVIELSLGTLDPPWTGTVDREVYVETKPTWAPHAGV